MQKIFLITPWQKLTQIVAKGDVYNITPPPFTEHDGFQTDRNISCSDFFGIIVVFYLKKYRCSEGGESAGGMRRHGEDVMSGGVEH